MKCAYCGKDFEPTAYRGLRKYCSRRCYFNARYHREHPKQAKQKICLTCGAEFETFFGQRKFCSDKCRNMWNNSKRHREKFGTVKPKVKQICPTCGAEFETTNHNKKFCSPICLRRYWRAKRRSHGSYIKTCPECGIEFETLTGQKVYCSAKCRKRAGKKRSEIPEIPTFVAPPKLKVKVEPPKPPKPPKPRRKVIIPAAISENRKPTVEELIEWIFSKEATA